MEAGEDPWAVARLQTGYVQLAKLQMYRGYTFFSARSCVREVYELDKEERALHLHEMSEVAHAIDRAFHPVKMNVEALGNGVPHLHWHLVPRHADDPRLFAPIWENLEFLRATWTGVEEEDPSVRDELKSLLAAELENSDLKVEKLL
jgi:diadenosine tetraphosphate (Ap4A) HIT family hydrolase